MINQNALTRAIRFALIGGMASVMSAPTFAQEATAPETLENVEVLGTRIKRTDSETASPVLTISNEAIQATGAATIGEFIQEIPSIAGAGSNPQVNNGGGDGAARISLRGLGSNRTLVLVNGRRFNSGDVNSIPINLVQSVEILKDGAAAIYGTDAIGGVVNFILRTDFEGFEGIAQYGVSGEDDGERKQASLTWGSTGENGNVVFGLKYDKTEPVLAADRDYSVSALTGVLSPDGSLALAGGGSSRNPNGFYRVPLARLPAGFSTVGCNANAAGVAVTRRAGSAGTAPGDFRCYIGSGPGNDTFNFQAEGNVVLTPQERYGLFSLAKYSINESFEAYAEMFFNNTTSTNQIASLPFDARSEGIPVSGQNVYNPFGVDITDARLRVQTLGPRRTGFETDDFQTTAGLRGVFGESWSYDVYGLYGRSKQQSFTSGALYSPAVAAALGPSFFAGPNRTLPTCGTVAAPIAGCIPIDLFGNQQAASSTLRGALGAIAPIIRGNSETSLSMFAANLQNADLIPFTDAGSIGAAAGIEYQKNVSSSTPDFLANTNNGTTPCFVTNDYCTSGLAGEYSQKEAYVEFFLPVLADVNFARRLNFTLGWRYSDYSTFGSTNNAKLGMEWKPIDELLVRGTFSQVFRAPSIGELFTGQTSSASTFSDPCNFYGSAANPRSATRDIACRFVPPNGRFEQTDSQLNGLVGGNTRLGPEEGETITFGFVYDPDWVDGVSTTIDFWRVSLDNVVGTYGTQNILDTCFRSADPVLCNLYSRRPESGEILQLSDTNQNIGSYETDGVDFGVLYKLPEYEIGQFVSKFDMTYINKFDNILPLPYTTDRGSYNQHLVGEFVDVSSGTGLGHFSRVRAQLSLDWMLGDWNASVQTRHVGAVDEFEGGNLTVVDSSANGSPDQRRVGAYAKTDLAVGYKLDMLKTKFTVGVDNVFDKQPPLVLSGFNAGTDLRTYDGVGRFYWIRATTRF